MKVLANVHTNKALKAVVNEILDLETDIAEEIDKAKAEIDKLVDHHTRLINDSWDMLKNEIITQNLATPEELDINTLEITEDGEIRIVDENTPTIELN